MVLGCTSIGGQEPARHRPGAVVPAAGRRRRAVQGPEHVEQRPGGRRAARSASRSGCRRAPPASSPRCEMNPVLLKPEADTRSQVVVRGRPGTTSPRVPWRERGPLLWPAMEQSLDALARDHELVVIEGAGSPAEINLADLVNNRVARARRCRRDAGRRHRPRRRLRPPLRHLVAGARRRPASGCAAFVLNKFRGDADAARARARRSWPSAPAWPRSAWCRCCTTSSPTRRGRPSAPAPAAGAARRGRAVPVRLEPRRVPPARPRGARAVRHPTGRPRRGGPRDPPRIEAHRRRPRLAAAPRLRRPRCADARGRRRGSLGICGGAMMLGRRCRDPPGSRAARGLGHAAARHRDGRRQDHPPNGGRVRRLCPTRGVPSKGARRAATRSATAGHGHGSGATGDARVWAQGRVLATTVHGLLEDAATCSRRSLGVRPPRRARDTFDALADAVDAHLDTDLCGPWCAAERPPVSASQSLNSPVSCDAKTSDEGVAMAEQTRLASSSPTRDRRAPIASATSAARPRRVGPVSQSSTSAATPSAQRHVAARKRRPPHRGAGGAAVRQQDDERHCARPRLAAVTASAARSPSASGVVAAGRRVCLESVAGNLDARGRGEQHLGAAAAEPDKRHLVTALVGLGQQAEHGAAGGLRPLGAPIEPLRSTVRMTRRPALDSRDRDAEAGGPSPRRRDRPRRR